MTDLPIFDTERLILRPVTESDAPAIQRRFNDYAIIGRLAHVVPWPYPDGAALDFIRTQILPRQGRTRWAWVLLLKQQPETGAIGCVDLFEGAHDNRGFWLAREFWGRGLMTEAVIPVTGYAFDHLGFDALLLNNAVGNQASRRVKEKTGARVLRREPASFVDPGYTEREVWELSKADWQRWRECHPTTLRFDIRSCDREWSVSRTELPVGAATDPAGPKTREI